MGTAPCRTAWTSGTAPTRLEDAKVNVILEQFHMMLAPPHKYNGKQADEEVA